MGKWSERPAVAVVTMLVLAPVAGEVLSTAKSPSELLAPFNLVMMVGLYGAGVLLVREIARRWELGWSGFLMLAAAYGVYEEGLVDRFWFDPTYWSDVDVGSYSAVGELNVVIAAHLTAFHMAVSVTFTVVVVERLFPGIRDRPWLGRGGLSACVVSLVLVPAILWTSYHVPAWPWLLFSAALIVLLVLLARRSPRPAVPAAPSAGERTRWLGTVAFLCTGAHFALAYSVDDTGLPWPVGVAVTMVPIGVGALVIRRRADLDPNGADVVRVVSGIAAWFVVLDVVIGLAGRFDLSVAGILMGTLLVWLSRRAT